ncbi:MAG: glutamine--fructose-6-phosphate transaminase (isomerizing) [Gammaproteobacteria bacterium CG11_big_fil_rev_8_21_14_0_20_46_22]|nr:MAG: glutamine--fructose-6-phosphate transaminase (isomerizing) [Gammaproteobacteria bacterium CG12_big_fil_rev_8_21_14_0_65_46_12]PIR11021.1 MAG: glutamine--fructose-6-phosphate transaminase (isomerizing) [Gammaproteobacteria bacterium CG11_big_fil_rev_8_21_14_0_20_46_22]
MCGIVAAVAERDVTQILLEGLKRLEYRGYDSAGVAVLSDNTIKRVRTEGKVASLEEALSQSPINGRLGIAHTRWATHGKPSERNAHPHMSGDIVLVHNGIIENFESLRERLKQEGYEFHSETDSETIAHLIHLHHKKKADWVAAVRAAIAELEGAYALAIMHKDHPDQLIGVRKGSPLVVGLGIGENFLSSDNLALLPVTQKFIFLEEGDFVLLTRESVEVFDAQHQSVERETYTSSLQHDAADRGEFRHYMLKEIYEQPTVMADTLQGRVNDDHVLIESFGPTAQTIFEKVQAVQIIACGTSYHAGLVAKYWIESVVGVPCQVEVASEFRYRKAAIADSTLIVTISQSGETADTLAALRDIQKKPQVLSTLTICNVPESSLVRESDLVFMTRAGTEVGVASTKAFTTQLVSLLLFTLALGRAKKIIGIDEAACVSSLKHLPGLCQEVLGLDGDIESMAEAFANKHHTLFLGRGVQYPIAMEGALKLKEISYIHAEAYPAGELKHGPLALVDEDMPIVALGPNDELLEKLKSNLQEVRARGGQLFVFADRDAGMKNETAVTVMNLPPVHPLLAPILYTLPLQLLSYHVAVIKGTDVDKPRNLAKSVTVE